MRRKRDTGILVFFATTIFVIGVLSIATIPNEVFISSESGEHFLLSKSGVKEVSVKPQENFTLINKEENLPKIHDGKEIIWTTSENEVVNKVNTKDVGKKVYTGILSNSNKEVRKEYSVLDCIAKVDSPSEFLEYKEKYTLPNKINAIDKAGNKVVMNVKWYDGNDEQVTKVNTKKIGIQVFNGKVEGFTGKARATIYVSDKR